MAGSAADAAKNVAGVAQEQVGQVVTEARQQVQQLVGQARSELTEQARVQQQRVAGGLFSVGDQLRAMAQGSAQPGPAVDLAHQAADKVHDIAGWLEGRDPGSVLDEVRSFARQRPGMFLAVALGAGVLAGRMARGLAADPDEAGMSSDGSPRPAAALLGYQDRQALPGRGQPVGVNGGSGVHDGWGATGVAPTAWDESMPGGGGR